MAGKNDLSDTQKFIVYFLVISVTITVVTFLPIFLWAPTSLVVYIALFFPLVISSVEGSLATYFYLPNKKKITRLSALSMMIIAFVSTCLHILYVIKEPSAIVESIFVIAFFCFIAISFYAIGSQISSGIVSTFLIPKLPDRDTIKKCILCYESKLFNPSEMFDTFVLLLEKLFDYNIEKRTIEEENHVESLMRIGNSDKYMFLKFSEKEKKVYILPLLLTDFILYSCDDKETKYVKSVLAVLLNFSTIEFSGDELDGVLEDMGKITQPASKDKLLSIKPVIKPVAAAVIVVLSAIALIFYYQHIFNFLQELAFYSNNTVLGGVIGAIIVLAIVGILKIFSKSFCKRIFKK